MKLFKNCHNKIFRLLGHQLSSQIFYSKFIPGSSAHFWIGLLVCLLLSCMCCLYILEINPLSIDSFANIFSHSEVVYSSCLQFPLLCKSFQVSFAPICLFLFFIPLLQQVDQKRSCCDFCQRVFFLCFPLRVLQCPVLHFGL